MRKSLLTLAVALCVSFCAFADSKYYKVSLLDGTEWAAAYTDDALCSNSQLHSEIWNDWDNSKELRDTMSYAIFESSFDRPVRVRIERKTKFREVEIRPSTYMLKAEVIDDRTVELTIPSYDMRKLSVEFDGDRQHNLFLIGSRPDNTPRDSVTYYFGPGEHEAGDIVLREGESLYIDYGAKVFASVSVMGSNCTISGHGVLSGERFHHHGNVYSSGKMLVVINPAHKRGFGNIVVKDITVIDSPSWSITALNTENLTVDGVNMICWELNGDGLDIICSHNVKIRNCLLRNYDDCITLKVRYNARPMSDLYDVEVSDCLIFNDYARGIVVGIENGNTRSDDNGHIHDIDIHDCIILENGTALDVSDLRSGIAIGQCASPENRYLRGSARKMSGIRIRDIVFDHISPTGRCLSILQYPDMAGTCLMTDVELENFTVLGYARMMTPAALVITNQHSIENLCVRNFTVDGKKITSPGLDFVVFGDAGVRFLR